MKLNVHEFKVIDIQYVIYFKLFALKCSLT
jgi:hypothetical protein